MLTDIPNIGKSIAGDLRGLGVNTPADVAAMDPIAMYEALRTPMGARHDPCVLDTFLAAKDFMNGGPAQTFTFDMKLKKGNAYCPYDSIATSVNTPVIISTSTAT